MGFPFVVDRSVKAELGDNALRELARNLHAGDCQACGRPLAGMPPSLVVDDLGAVVSAALYHQSCRASAYCTARGLAVDGAYLTYEVVSSVLKVLLDGGGELALPLVMINPSMEQVVLRRNPLGLWTCGTVEHFRDAGLRGIDTHQPVPGGRVEFAGNVLRVWVGATGGQYWDCPLDVPDLRKYVHARGGVAVALTTVHVPTQLIAAPAAFAAVLESEDVASGWVALAG